MQIIQEKELRKKLKNINEMTNDDVWNFLKECHRGELPSIDFFPKDCKPLAGRVLNYFKAMFCVRSFLDAYK